MTIVRKIKTNIRNWLDVPTPDQIRSLILKEIDADAVWREKPHADIEDFPVMRDELGRHREAEIILNKREDTRE